MTTPRQVVALARILFACFALVLTGALLGPFQGAEKYIGLSDIAAHVLAFYVLTIALLSVAPRSRREDLALIIVAFAIATEVLQGLTGRSMSLGDFAADMGGLIAATLPSYIDRLRYLVRTQPDLDFAIIAAEDRRHRANAPLIRLPKPADDTTGAISANTPA
jgi:VanZ family protein